MSLTQKTRTGIPMGLPMGIKNPRKRSWKKSPRAPADEFNSCDQKTTKVINIEDIYESELPNWNEESTFVFLKKQVSTYLHVIAFIVGGVLFLIVLLSILVAYDQYLREISVVPSLPIEKFREFHEAMKLASDLAISRLLSYLQAPLGVLIGIFISISNSILKSPTKRE